MKNTAIFMQGTNQMTSREISVPTLVQDEVLIRVDTVGICGSDVHYFQHGRIGDFVVEGDFILGHECAGEVVQVGEGVSHLKVGDRVALEPGKTCGQCIHCKTGKYNLCEAVEFFATPPYQGVFSNYVKHAADLCFKLPETVSFEEGALVEPLAVGMHAAAQGEVGLGDTVVIFGAGCIGLVTLMACKARGATKVIVVDILDKRLEKAKAMGADAIVNPMNGDVLKEIQVLTNQAGAHVVIETAGAEITVKQTANVVARGGRIVLVGMTAKSETSFDFMKLMGKEADVKTIFRYRNIYPSAIEAIASGLIDVKQIVSHTFDFEETETAFNYVIEHPEDVIKAVIKIK